MLHARRSEMHEFSGPWSSVHWSLSRSSEGADSQLLTHESPETQTNVT